MSYHSNNQGTFANYCSWLQETMQNMFENLPTDLREMPHTEQEMAELSYYQAYAHHYTEGDKNDLHSERDAVMKSCRFGQSNLRNDIPSENRRCR